MRQFGSLMGTQEDIVRRQQQATIAFRNVFSLWKRREKLSEGRRIRLYKAYVLPSLMYNCCTWGVNETVRNKLDAFHRCQLRSLIGIKYSTIITNEELYTRCHSVSISEIVDKRRMEMLGHVLRLNPDSPSDGDVCHHFGP